MMRRYPLLKTTAGRLRHRGRPRAPRVGERQRGPALRRHRQRHDGARAGARAQPGEDGAGRPTWRRGEPWLTKKLQIAIYWGAACGGCDVAVLDTNEFILDIAAVADIRLWPIATDGKYKDVEAMEDGELDVAIFNGAVRNSENEHIAKLLRQKSKVFVAYGVVRLTWAASPGWPTSCHARRSSNAPTSTTRPSNPATAQFRSPETHGERL